MRRTLSSKQPIRNMHDNKREKPRRASLYTKYALCRNKVSDTRAPIRTDRKRAQHAAQIGGYEEDPSIFLTLAWTREVHDFWPALFPCDNIQRDAELREEHDDSEAAADGDSAESTVAERGHRDHRWAPPESRSQEEDAAASPDQRLLVAAPRGRGVQREAVQGHPWAHHARRVASQLRRQHGIDCFFFFLIF